MDPLARLLDANANRAREALRTLEDTARFALGDAASAQRCKRLRHALRETLAALPPGLLAANRDVPGDVGRTIETKEEFERSGLPAVAAAAEGRLGESLRVLEEGLKVIDPALARRAEGIRYESYDLAAAITRRVPGRRREQWRVCLLLTETLCRRPWRDVARAALDGGAEAIQLREKSLDGAELAERSRELVALARPVGARVIVNDRADVALAAGADGVHLGASDLRVADVRSFAGHRLIIGASTHDLDEAARAVEAGADYCGVGAMFPTAVKPEAFCAGPAYLAAFARAYPRVPHLAIGGIDEANLDRLLEAGCRGVALSSAVCGAEHPDRIVAALRRTFEATPREVPA